VELWSKDWKRGGDLIHGQVLGAVSLTRVMVWRPLSAHFTKTGRAAALPIFSRMKSCSVGPSFARSPTDRCFSFAMVLEIDCRVAGYALITKPFFSSPSSLFAWRGCCQCTSVASAKMGWAGTRREAGLALQKTISICES